MTLAREDREAVGSSGTVRIRPLEADIEVGEAEAIMAAARRQGYSWPTVCQGRALCGTCWVVVEDGDQHCSPVEAKERATLERERLTGDPRARLGCQLRIHGPVTVSREGIRGPGRTGPG